MKQATLSLLDQFFAKEPIMKASGVDFLEIDAAEQALNVVFAEDYREFLRLYGGAVVGPYPIYGLAHVDLMDMALWSVVRVTENFRKQLWPGTNQAYVISMDHAGNPICLDEGGKVFSFDHDAGEMIEVANDFEEYLLKCLSSC